MLKHKTADPTILKPTEVRKFMITFKPHCPNPECDQPLYSDKGRLLPGPVVNYRLEGAQRISHGETSCNARVCVCKSCGSRSMILPTREALEQSGVSAARIGELGFSGIVEEALRQVADPSKVFAVAPRMSGSHHKFAFMHADGFWFRSEKGLDDFSAGSQGDFENRMI